MDTTRLHVIWKFLSIGIGLVFSPNVAFAEPVGISPDGRYVINVKDAYATGTELWLQETHTSKTVGCHVLIGKPKHKIKSVWSERSDAVAFEVHLSNTTSLTPAFFRTASGQIRSFELTQFTGNLGKLGEPKNHWVKIRNFPVAWDAIQNDVGDRFVKVTTQAWDKSGQRFTVSESVKINKDGNPLQR